MGTCDESGFVTVPIISPFKDTSHDFSEAEKIYDTITIINLIISVVFEN
jgi:hypothetical protein